MEVDVFCMNGLVLTVECLLNETFGSLKERLWSGFPFLQQYIKADYEFEFVSSDSLECIVADDCVSLDVIFGMAPIVRMVHRKTPSIDINSDIRSPILTICNSDIDNDLLAPLHSFVADVCAIEDSDNIILRSSNCPELFITTPSIHGTIKIDFLYGSREFFSESVDIGWKPSEVIYRLREKMLCGHDDHGVSYLKIKNRNEIMFENFPIIQYKYVYNCFAFNTNATLELIILKSPIRSATVVPLTDYFQISRQNSTKSCDHNEYLVVEVCGFLKKFRLGLYHGGELHEEQKTSKHRKEVRFLTCIKDIPRDAVISLLSTASKTRKWANIPIFRMDGKLTSSFKNLPLNDSNQESTKLVDRHGFFISGDIVTEKYKECTGKKHSVSLFINRAYNNIYYCCPQLDESSLTPILSHTDESEANFGTFSQVLQNDFETSKNIIKSDILLREYTWNNRYFLLNISSIRNHTYILPLIVCVVDWWNCVQVSQLYHFVDQPREYISLFSILLLFKQKYTDSYVRQKLVEHLLTNVEDNVIRFFLPQLIKALDYDIYFDSPLLRMLLIRSFFNRSIAVIFIWTLRMIALEDTSFRHKYNLVRQIYQMLFDSQFKINLKKQENAVKCISKIADAVSSQHAAPTFLLRAMLAKHRSKLQNWYSPLSPTILLGELKLEKCMVFDSNRRPLKLVWTNSNCSCDGAEAEISLIFKQGDDLCHEAITLQTLELFESFWNFAMLNLPLMPYKVFPILQSSGFIEMVPNSRSVLTAKRDIRVRSGMNPFTFLGDGQPLYEWLVKMNAEKRDLEFAVSTFTRSCVGYSVASDVLGFGDRHPSNILICNNGQMVHIDFAYMFGHYIKAGPISRELTPIALVNDFVDVMKHLEGNDSLEFFFQLCEKAFVILRDRVYDICSILLYSERGIEGIKFIRDFTLLTKKNEDDARRVFLQRIIKSRDWSILRTIDWEFHAAAHPTHHAVNDSG